MSPTRTAPWTGGKHSADHSSLMDVQECDGQRRPDSGSCQAGDGDEQEIESHRKCGVAHRAYRERPLPSTQLQELADSADCTRRSGTYRKDCHGHKNVRCQKVEGREHDATDTHYTQQAHHTRSRPNTSGLFQLRASLFDISGRESCNHLWEYRQHVASQRNCGERRETRDDSVATDLDWSQECSDENGVNSDQNEPKPRASQKRN